MSHYRNRRLLVVLAITWACLSPARTWAAESAPNGLLLDGYRVAQIESDDAYDPFADYSEFEESADEEADMNFFRNGRFFTMGLVMGYRGFTGTYGDIYGSSALFGVNVTYFFDLRFAMTVGFLNSDHQFFVKGPSENIIGNVNLQNILFHLKYYLNTQNVTRGLADLNPYIVGGFAQTFRIIKISGQSVYGRDSATGFDGGLGLEIPMLRKKMFLGVEAFYQFINFSDENNEILQSDGVTHTGISPSGDSWVAMAILGVNF